ncbi:MAG: sulfur carrier protein ThiS [Candidatus Methanomethylophilaceae archaeon]|nr:sulfur carrier protein ThiS [Candidatus Methanomethylophilaceae archaeon]
MSREGSVTVNGSTVPIGPSTTVGDLVRSLGYDTSRVAVELDGGICPRATLDDVVLSDGQVLEVVGFVGGG